MVMLISYHIKAELCTLFDKVHKAFINSANASLYFLPSADGKAFPPIQRRSRWRRLDAPWLLPSAEGERFRRSGGLPPQARLAADGQAGHCRRLAAEVPVFTGGVRRAHGEGHKGGHQGFHPSYESPRFLLASACHRTETRQRNVIFRRGDQCVRPFLYLYAVLAYPAATIRFILRRRDATVSL